VSIFADASPSVQGERSPSDPVPVLFSRFERFVAAKMPLAARRIYDVLHDAARKLGPNIKLTIAEIIDRLPWELKVKRRCISKGLRQLELMGIIFRDRCRFGGVRIINFLREFVTNRPTSAKSKAGVPVVEAPAPPTPESLEPSEPLPRSGAEYHAFVEAMFGFEPGTTGAMEAGGLKPATRKISRPPAGQADHSPPPEAPRPADE
jgi:hypothetical protein